MRWNGRPFWDGRGQAEALKMGRSRADPRSAFSHSKVPERGRLPRAELSGRASNRAGVAFPPRGVHPRRYTHSVLGAGISAQQGPSEGEEAAVDDLGGHDNTSRECREAFDPLPGEEDAGSFLP